MCLHRHLVAQEIRREQEKAVSHMFIDGNASDGDMPDDTDDPNELLVCNTDDMYLLYSKLLIKQCHACSCMHTLYTALM
jgi:hypothetical protein